MRTNKLTSDFFTSPIGYGCYALSGAYGEKLDEAKMIKVIQQAYQWGVGFYDTADQYGDTEELLGKAVKPFRDQIMIASKVGVTEDMKPNLTREHVLKSCETSLKNLQTSYLDLYQVHFDDPDTSVAETLEALEQLKKEGKIRYYGVGHLPLERTLEYLKLGNVSTVLAEMSPVAMSRYRELSSLQNKYGFGIIAFSVTGRGLLTGKVNVNTEFLEGDIRRVDPLFKKGKFVSGLRVVTKLREIGERYGRTPAQVAISWVVQQPGVVAALTGPTKIEHLKENLAVLKWQLNQADLLEMDQFLVKEEIALENKIKQEIFDILNTSLHSNFDQAVNDLIYVLENSIEYELLQYQDGVSIYLKLLKLRKNTDKSRKKIIEIQDVLKSCLAH